MSNAKSAYGTLLKRGDGGAPEIFTTVPEVRSISGPSLEVDEAEVTTHSSAQLGAFKEFVATLIDAGHVEFEINYIPGDVVHRAIRDDMLARTKRNWKLVNPENTETFNFNAFVKSGPYEFPTDNVMKQKLSLRITQAPTWV